MAGSSNWPTTSSMLLARMRDRDDSESWEDFVRVYAPLVYRYCIRRGLQDADAQDVTQDAMIDVARAIESFEYDREKGRFRGWLGTLVRHAIHRHVEKSARPGRGTGGDACRLLMEIPTVSGDDSAWIEECNAQVYRTALERVRSKVGEETWRAFREVWLEERKPAEVAKDSNRSPDWVYRAKFRALSLLKQEVAALTYDDLRH